MKFRLLFCFGFFLCGLNASEKRGVIAHPAAIDNVDIEKITVYQSLRNEENVVQDVLAKGNATLVTVYKGLGVALDNEIVTGINKEWKDATPVRGLDIPMSAPDRIAIIVQNSPEDVFILSFLGGRILMTKGRRVVSGVYQFNGESFAITDFSIARELAAIRHNYLIKLDDAEE